MQPEVPQFQQPEPAGPTGPGPVAVPDDPEAAVLDLRDRISRIQQDRNAGSAFSPVSAGRDRPSADANRRRGQGQGQGRTRGRGATRSDASEEPGDEVPRTTAEYEAAARSICLRLLTGSARTRADLASALSRKGIPELVAQRVLDRYTEVGLIDDGAYAHAFVRTKHRERGLGRRSLAVELRRKGVAEVDAEAALATIDTEDERVRARQLVERRAATALTAGPDAARRRLLNLLARRGYPPDLAFEVVDSVLRDHGLDDGDGRGGDSGADFGL